ncbi:hypothetical protein FRZ61_08230 [Hypericibacter adhaerens]|uniref:Uncharacterized protein n=1 Tax=Hypericibacter adhaerens TaxID=2602016 RepID=A0A5J6MUS5_9PROT|nr:hypothetical protein FRZ61_08230 [Hypericibacter adhaerens]
MIAIGAPADDMEIEIDLGACAEMEGGRAHQLSPPPLRGRVREGDDSLVRQRRKSGAHKKAEDEEEKERR